MSDEIIQYEQLVAFLKQASLFEIYRLSRAIKNELEDPERITVARKQFKEGEVVQYFDDQTNTLIPAQVIKKNQKYVLIQNCEDGRQWKLPYFLIKVNSQEFDFNSSARGLSKNALKVGDWVGFNKDGEEIVGRVERLNQKTASLITETNHRWRVAYQLLYAIIDGQKVSGGKLKQKSLFHSANIIDHQPLEDE